MLSNLNFQYHLDIQEDGMMKKYDVVIEELNKLDFHKNNHSQDNKVLQNEYTIYNEESEGSKDLLKNNNELLKNIFDSISDGVSVLNKNFEIIIVNKTMKKLYEDKLPFSGKKCYDIYQNRTSICPWCPSKKAIENKSVESTIVCYPNESNVKGWLSLTCFPLINDSNEVYGVIEQVKDITNHKKIEDRLRMISDVTTDLIYEWDVQNNTLEWFGDIDRILGYKKGEIQKTIEGWSNLIHPEDIKNLSDPVERRRIRTEAIEEIYRVRKKDGSWIYWQDRGKPILDSDGKPVKWIGGCKDITNERNIEKQFRDEKIFIDSILKSLPGVFYLFDENGQFIRWNKNFEKVTEYSSDELKTMTPIDLFDADEKEKIASAIQKAFVTGYAEVEGNFFTKSRKKKPYFFTGVATIYRGNSLLVGVGIDLSNIRNTQNELKKRIEELETVEQLAVNRELRMIELKCEVNELLLKNGMEEKYKID